MNVNLELFSVGDLQKASVILSVFEGEGVVDSRYVREGIEKHLHVKRQNILSHAVRNRKSVERKPVTKPCPDCGHTMRLALVNKGDPNVFACKNCRYSEVTT